MRGGVAMKDLNFVYMDYVNVNLKLKNRRTVLNGDSATGKSYLYNIIEQYAMEEKRKDIVCIDIDNFDADKPENSIDKIKKVKNGIVAIDQADDILINTKIREYVMSDTDNYYIIMGRRYYKKYSELAKTKITKDRIEIKYRLNTI